MNDQAWVALGALVLAFLAYVVATVWWAATINAKVKELEGRANEHTGIRDAVIRLEANVENLTKTVNDFVGAVRDSILPSRQRTQRRAGDQG
jgi:hypothetical protein